MLPNVTTKHRNKNCEVHRHFFISLWFVLTCPRSTGNSLRLAPDLASWMSPPHHFCHQGIPGEERAKFFRESFLFEKSARDQKKSTTYHRKTSMRTEEIWTVYSGEEHRKILGGLSNTVRLTRVVGFVKSTKFCSNATIQLPKIVELSEFVEMVESCGVVQIIR